MNQTETTSISSEDEAENKRFREHLAKCHAEVATWPEWKQNLLGLSYSKKKALGLLD